MANHPKKNRKNTPTKGKKIVKKKVKKVIKRKKQVSNKATLSGRKSKSPPKSEARSPNTSGLSSGMDSDSETSATDAGPNYMAQVIQLLQLQQEQEKKKKEKKVSRAVRHGKKDFDTLADEILANCRAAKTKDINSIRSEMQKLTEQLNSKVSDMEEFKQEKGTCSFLFVYFP